MKTAKNWKEMETQLARQGITIAYKFRCGTGEVQGVSFEKDDVKMKGSAIDRSLSFSKIDANLNRNQKVQQYHIARETGPPSLASQLHEVIRQNVHAEHLQSHDGGKGLLEILLEPQFSSVPDPMGDADKARKKRKKRQAEQSQGISR
ncbi:MAG: Relaxase [Mucilaginibacter sp.]|nr:Relaxase [Mucilaginibacter sp.]